MCVALLLRAKSVFGPDDAACQTIDIPEDTLVSHSCQILAVVQRSVKNFDTILRISMGPSHPNFKPVKNFVLVRDGHFNADVLLAILPFKDDWRE